MEKYLENVTFNDRDTVYRVLKSNKILNLSLLRYADSSLLVSLGICPHDALHLLMSICANNGDHGDRQKNGFHALARSRVSDNSSRRESGHSVTSSHSSLVDSDELDLSLSDDALDEQAATNNGEQNDTNSSVPDAVIATEENGDAVDDCKSSRCSVATEESSDSEDDDSSVRRHSSRAKGAVSGKQRSQARFIDLNSRDIVTIYEPETKVLVDDAEHLCRDDLYEVIDTNHEHFFARLYDARGRVRGISIADIIRILHKPQVINGESVRLRISYAVPFGNRYRDVVDGKQVYRAIYPDRYYKAETHAQPVCDSAAADFDTIFSKALKNRRRKRPPSSVQDADDTDDGDQRQEADSDDDSDDEGDSDDEEAPGQAKRSDDTAKHSGQPASSAPKAKRRRK